MKIKLRQVNALFKLGILSEQHPLVHGYDSRSGDYQLRYNLNKLHNIKSNLLLIGIISSVFFAIGYYSDSKIILVPAIVMVFMGLAMLWELRKYYKNCIRFTKCLDDLVLTSQTPLRKMIMQSEEDLKKIASSDLVSRAFAIEAEEGRYGKLSDEAECQRQAFKKEHRVYLAFNLVNDTWDVYFQKLPPPKE